MSQFLTFAHALKNDEDGATMIEYSLLAGLVSIVIVASLIAIKPNLELIWGEVNQAIADAAPAADG